MDKDIKKIILKRPYLTYNATCNHCGSHSTKSSSTNIEFTCETCKKRNMTNAYIGLYQAYLDLVIKALGVENYNHVLLSGVKENKKIIDYSPSNKFEEDVYDCLLKFKHNFKLLPFLVTDITIDKIPTLYTECLDCFVCHQCVTCCDCQMIYSPKYYGKDLIYQCPKCRSVNYKPTIIKESKAKSCPHCKSKNITHPKVLTENKECNCCGSKNLKKPNLVSCYQLTISHQERNRR